MNPLVEELLLRSAVLFLMAGSLAGMLVGVLLLLNPQRLQRANLFLSRWVSTRKLNQSLERTVEFDSLFYRFRRTSGVLTLLGSLYILYYFTVTLNRTSAVAGFSVYFKLSATVIEGVLDAVVMTALAGALFAAFVSLFLLLRPSMLRDFELGANRWVSFRQALKPLERKRERVDEYVFKYGRQAGVMLMLGSLYTLVLLTYWLQNYH